MEDRRRLGEENTNHVVRTAFLRVDVDSDFFKLRKIGRLLVATVLELIFFISIYPDPVYRRRTFHVPNL